MKRQITLWYGSLSDLRAHLEEHASQGAIMLPVTELPDDIEQYEVIELVVEVEDSLAEMKAEVLQVLGGNGLVVKLTDAGEVAKLAEASQPAARAELPLVSIGAPRDETTAPAPSADAAAGDPGAQQGSARGPAGAGPITWSVERLQAGWDSLNVSERIRVARYGNRAARHLILRGIDKTLHTHVLANPRLSPEEVASMAAMPNLDPPVLRRIANSAEWLRHSAVARGLVCNPKLPLPLVPRVLRHVPREELFRLSRTGKVRASVKREIVKYLDRQR